MIIVGEKSGNLPEILLKLGNMFEGKTDTTTKNLSVILEPILLVIVWLGVVSVALAVILPIYSLVGGLNEGQNPTNPPVVVPSPENSVDIQESENATSTESVVEEVESVEGQFRVTSDLEFLNVRSGPSADFGKVGELYPEDLISEVERIDEWIRFGASDEFPEGGWVSLDFVETVE